MDGQVAESVRSLTKDDMKRLYENTILNRACSKTTAQASRDYLIYLLSFLCMLRIDETLSIKGSCIEYPPNQYDYFKITLHHRKTHQTGSVKPFVLWRNDAVLHLCPVRALLAYFGVLGAHITPNYNDFIFCKIDSSGMPHPGNALAQQAFRSVFVNDVKSIVGKSYYLYGTHSFRRGGCQYFHCDLKWNLKRVCDWGGWSVAFDNMTIVRYLVSTIDAESCAREDYLRPDNLK